MSVPSRRETGVLLDIDGTLLDSNDAHAQSWVEIFRRYGYDICFGRVRSLIGKGSDKLLPELTGLDSEAGKGKANHGGAQAAVPARLPSGAASDE